MTVKGKVKGMTPQSAPYIFVVVRFVIPGEGSRGKFNRGAILEYYTYRRTSISGTTFSGKKCLSGTSFHAF
jgi:hypothetical protein